MIVREKTFKKWCDCNIKEHYPEIAERAKAGKKFKGLKHYCKKVESMNDVLKLHKKFSQEIFNEITKYDDKFSNGLLGGFIDRFGTSMPDIKMGITQEGFNRM